MSVNDEEDEDLDGVARKATELLARIRDRKGAQAFFLERAEASMKITERLVEAWDDVEEREKLLAESRRLDRELVAIREWMVRRYAQDEE